MRTRISIMLLAAISLISFASLAAEAEEGKGGCKESDFCKSLEYAAVAVNEPGYHCWGASPVIDEQGKVHLFVARWPVKTPDGKRIPFNPHGWRQYSEIAHYVGDKPEGPFEFCDVALKGTGEDTWDRYAPHNPCIRKVDGKYVLLFIANRMGMTKGKAAHTRSQRIGMALADSPYGPWKKVGKGGLILSPSDDPEHWSYRAGNGVVNPAFVKGLDGRYYLYYKSERARMGVAVADKLAGPYIHEKDPITSNKRTIEDGCAFISKGKYCFLTTDNHGIAAKGGGLLWKSSDGINFEDKPEIGFRDAFYYLHADGVKKDKSTKTRRYYGGRSLQRPQVLCQDGVPTHLYAATGENFLGGDGTMSVVLRVDPEKLKVIESE